MNHELKKFPTEFLERLRKIVPPGLMSQVAHGFLEEKPTTFRVNMLKSTSFDVEKNLKKEGLEIEPAGSLPLAYQLKKGSFKKLQGSVAYQEGWIYLQSFSSQIPPLVLAPKPGDHVLDMAAAPGGKTTQMAAMMKDQGVIVALEPDKIRFERLVYNLAKQGASCVTPVNTSVLHYESEPLFDHILLDAPCSSEGTFCLRRPASFIHWSESFVIKQSQLQKKMMTQAVRLLKPGGTLVYSTCALSPEENEVVLDDVLKQQAEMTLLPIPLKYPFLKPVLPAWGSHVFNKTIPLYARRIFPSVLMEGFFVGCLQKKSES